MNYGGFFDKMLAWLDDMVAHGGCPSRDPYKACRCRRAWAAVRCHPVGAAPGLIWQPGTKPVTVLRRDRDARRVGQHLEGVQHQRGGSSVLEGILQVVRAFYELCMVLLRWGCEGQGGCGGLRLCAGQPRGAGFVQKYPCHRYYYCYTGLTQPIRLLARDSNCEHPKLPPRIKL
jgi:hypothetical protein